MHGSKTCLASLTGGDIIIIELDSQTDRQMHGSKTCLASLTGGDKIIIDLSLSSENLFFI